jgi:hypothetical protein
VVAVEKYPLEFLLLICLIQKLDELLLVQCILLLSHHPENMAILLVLRYYSSLLAIDRKGRKRRKVGEEFMQKSLAYQYIYAAVV